MKKTFNLKTFILSLFLMAGTTAVFAQCDKAATFTASVSTYLNDKSDIEKTKNEETIVKLDKKEISIITNGRIELAGAIKSYTCNWADPFKTGKTIVSTTMVDGGNELHCLITIEGKEGKVTLAFEAAEMPGKKIVLVANKFE
ncbi:MAG: hypothetical protein V4520_06355 [Bacteroidota bacterium]